MLTEWCTACQLCVGKPPLGIFAFQHNVHHVEFLLVVSAQPFAAVCRFVMNLHVLHCIGWQVVEQHPLVVFEKVFTVEQQFVYLLAVHQNPAVILQLHTVELADQRVKHRPFGQIECVGIIYDGVALDNHLNLGGTDGHTVEHTLHHLCLCGFLLHQMPRSIEISVARHVFDFIIDVKCFVFRVLCTDDVF